MVFVIGTLVGLEIPLLMRILKDETRFQGTRLAGALLSTTSVLLSRRLLFPIFLVPKSGTEPNVAALWNAKRSRRHLGDLAAGTAGKNRTLSILRVKGSWS